MDMSVLGSEISIVIITSPAPSNPRTTLIDRVIGSCCELLELVHSPFVIVLDGYFIEESARTKKGKVTSEMAANYEIYYNNLLRKYGGNKKFSFIKCSEHHGFAMGVKIGLESCSTRYGLVLQHDRAFIKEFQFAKFAKLLQIMENYNHIRYIGFPTSMNYNHDLILHSQYKLFELASLNSRISLDEDLELLPLIFWYDSNHLCIIERYLQIFQPYKNLPQELKLYLGLKNIGKMILKRGDFIEDRFGQQQRNIIANSIIKKDEKFTKQLFQWFGSYLIWKVSSGLFPPSGGMILDEEHKEFRKSRVFVTHLRGRQYNPSVYNYSHKYSTKEELLDNFEICTEEENHSHGKNNGVFETRDSIASLDCRNLSIKGDDHVSVEGTDISVKVREVDETFERYEISNNYYDEDNSTTYFIEQLWGGS